MCVCVIETGCTWVWLRVYGCVCLLVFLWMKLTAAIFVYVKLHVCVCDRDRLYVGMAACVWLRVFICVPVDEINRCHLCVCEVACVCV